MSKTAITRLFVVGLVACIIGVILEVAVVIGTFGGGVIVLGGPDLIQINGGSFAWALVGLALLGALIIGLATLATLASWLGALYNTFQLEDKSWFIVLLLLGLFSFGFVAMVAYVIAGPDSAKQAQAGPGVATAARI